MVKKVAVLTSGGDAPGMNAAIRAVVRTGLYYGYEVYGIADGYKGLYEGRIERMHRSSVSEKMNHGGTFLGTARLKRFTEKEVLEACFDNLKELGIDSLIVIGGDGTYR
ncbi:MAG: 6-phosphofructokinase, partial [Bacilli bacterium]|nr:6-phosphofructokinase [Bacilli bacterium]